MENKKTSSFIQAGEETVCLLTRNSNSASTNTRVKYTTRNVQIETAQPGPSRMLQTGKRQRALRRKYAGKKSRLNQGSNSQPPGHESDTLTTEPPGRGRVMCIALLPNSSQICSIGLRSGELDGQSNLRMLNCQINSLTTRPRWVGRCHPEGQPLVSSYRETEQQLAEEFRRHIAGH